MSLQILQEWNVLLQIIEHPAVHGLFASSRSIRQLALRSQTKMVGAAKKSSPVAAAFAQHHRLRIRLRTQRRRVDGSGKRVGSLQCGAACSTESPPASLSQACCRQRKL